MLGMLITIKVNKDIADRYLQSDGKTQAMYGIIEALVFY
jgi:hypothetical protein